MNKKSIIFIICQFTWLFLHAQQSNKKPLTWQDIPTWQFIRTNEAKPSNDGQWLAYTSGPTSGDLTLTLQKTKDTTNYTYKIGGLNTAIEFNNNNQFVAFFQSPGYNQIKANQKARKPNSRNLKLISLADTASKLFEKVQSFTFSNENNDWLALRFENIAAAGPRPTNTPKGTDLLLYNLVTQKEYNIGNISEFRFNKTGQYVAYIIDANNQNGNGVFLLNLSTGVTTALENDKANYSKLNWNKEGTAFTLLKSTKDKDYKTPVFSILAAKNIKNNQAKLYSYNGLKEEQLPEGYGISENRTPSWSKDLSSLFFGIAKIEKSDEAKKAAQKEKSNQKDSTVVSVDSTSNTIAASKDSIQNIAKRAPSRPVATPNKKDLEKPDMIIWNWQDQRLQSTQKNQLQRDKSFNMLSSWNVETDKYSSLTDSTIKSISLAPNQQIGYGFDITPYAYNANLDGQNYADLYIIDVKTGNRKLAIEKFYLNASRGGIHFAPNSLSLLFYQDGDYHIMDVNTLTSVNITQSIPSTFIDAFSDHNITKPSTSHFGWTSDSKYVLIKDNYDLWKIGKDGKSHQQLTSNWKEAKLIPVSYNKIYEDDESIDLKKDQYFHILDYNTKQKGVALLAANSKNLEILKLDDIHIGPIRKVKDADSFFYTIENSNTAPEIYSSNKHLKTELKHTSNTPDTSKFEISSGSKLISYISDHGDTLQATLYLPANYIEGKSYPTITYIYERLTDSKNNYANPSYPGGGFNRAMYTSNGYAVLMPDIKYKLNEPGMSALACVVPAVKEAIKTGIVDAENVAIHGHSWGGYQTSFLITQTNIFKAAVAGAPLTNMISMYSLIYWNSGSTNQSIFESSQGRLTTGYWDNWKAYAENSPVYHIKNVNTPLIIMHNDKDGAVDYTQGIEYFNGLRRLNKPVVMLTYNGENHGLVKEVNKKDYAVRMMEYFDHYLKGEPAPLWWSKGIDYIDMPKHLEDRAF